MRLFQFGLIGLLFLPLLKLQPFSEEWNSMFENISYLNSALIGLGIGCAISILESNFFRFLCLYFLLYLKGLIPFNLVRFLNQVTDHTGLLEPDGGQWRFRHQLLQDALAEQWEEQNKSTPPPPSHR